VVEGPVPGQADGHDGHDGTVPEPAGGCQPPGRLNELAAMDVDMVEMPTDRHRPNLAALTRGWSDLPPPPAAPGPGAVTVWTGTRLFLWGGEDGRGHPARGAGWLFDPVGRRWRATAATALPGRSRPAVAWTGQEVLVWGGDVEGRSFGDGAAYNPARDTWRALPPAPIPARAPAAWAWTGRELLAWDYELRASAYDPAGDRWRRLDPVPLGEAECYPQSAAAGRVVFAQFCSEHALWDRRSRRWARVGRDLELGAVVATGPVFLFAGAETGPAGPGSGRLLAYNPG
jgi:hypothetical protein